MRASILVWACLVWPSSGRVLHSQQEESQKSYGAEPSSDPSATLAALLINAANPSPAFAMPHGSAARPCQSPACRHRQSPYMQFGGGKDKVSDLEKQLELLKEEEAKQKARQRKVNKKDEFKRQLSMLQRGADSSIKVKERQQESLTKSQQFQNRLQSLRNEQIAQWEKQESAGITKMVRSPKGFDMFSMSYRYDNAGDAFGGKIPQELLSEAWKDEFKEPWDWRPIIGLPLLLAGWIWLGLQPYGQDDLDPITYGGYQAQRDSPAEIRRRFEAAGGYLYGPEDSVKMKISDVNKLFDTDEPSR